MTQAEDAMRMVEGPVVRRADPFDAEGGTVELTRPGVPPSAWPRDPLAPGRGPRGWLAGFGFVLRRCSARLVPAVILAALPAHFFVGPVDDTVVAAPALSDLAGVFGLLLLPLMWLAYFAVSALPHVILLAGTVAVTVPAAASGAAPRLRTAWRLVAHRLRVLWPWLAAFGLVVQALRLLLTADRLGLAVAAQLAIGLGLAAVAALTITGVLGCVVLVEGGPGLRRAVHLLARGTAGPLVVASLGVLLLPRLGELVAGGIGSTMAAVVAILVWSAAAVVTYTQARFADGTAVSSGQLLGELTESGAA
jgi:hypothetical protein